MIAVGNLLKNHYHNQAVDVGVASLLDDAVVRPFEVSDCRSDGQLAKNRHFIRDRPLWVKAPQKGV